MRVSVHYAIARKSVRYFAYAAVMPPIIMLAHARHAYAAPRTARRLLQEDVVLFVICHYVTMMFD